jgi:hypothetical protein
VAWRCWGLWHTPGLLVSRLDPFKPPGSIEWQAGWQPPAACAFHDHAAPDPGCRCGWRGEPDLTVLTWWLAYFKRVNVHAIGRVELGGRILVGDSAHQEIPHIRRAEYARVVGPLVLGPGHERHAGPLADRYGIDDVRQSSEPWLAWKTWVLSVARDLAGGQQD